MEFRIADAVREVLRCRVTAGAGHRAAVVTTAREGIATVNAIKDAMLATKHRIRS